MSIQTILVVGATGTQGGSVVTALLSASAAPPTLKILALTRSTTSTKARALAALDSRIQLVQGDPTAAEAIFIEAATQIDAVFCVTVHGAKGAEEAQARGLIDAALKHGVQHFVFTSADRGGERASNTTPTPVPHIATKHRIEGYLKAATQGTPMTWTILRPVTFMDNLTADFPGKGFGAMWRQVGARPIQVVAAADIGVFGARALLDREGSAGRAVGIAGDELNYAEAANTFRRVMGRDMPSTFCAVGSVLKMAMPDIGAMFTWFETAGFAVDIEAARRENPALKDFATWLREDSGFKRNES